MKNEIPAPAAAVSENDERFAYLNDWKGLNEKDRAYYIMTETLFEEYILSPDSQAKHNVPAGKVTKYRMNDCTIYPGVARDYYIYVPAQYNPEKPAALTVYLDGSEYMDYCNAHIMMDNLIHQKEMPVTIGLFIAPGDKGPGYPIYGGSDNRSIEYDSIDEKFSEFLAKDMLPILEKQFNISTDPASRCIVGMSSAGNAAFVAAWHRPDLFGKVISHSGSFTNLRGGHLMPTLVRTEEKRNIRIFLQTNKLDLNTVFGDWRMANQYMASSLEYKGYDYEFFEGTGGHTYKCASQMLPNTMRWMWRDYPKD